MDIHRIVFIMVWTRPFLDTLRVSFDWFRLDERPPVTLNYLIALVIDIKTGIAKGSLGLKQIIQKTSRGINLVC